MLSLADWQRTFLGAIAGGPAEALRLAPSPLPHAAAFAVHRNTVTGALVDALRLSFPSVERLVGEAWFDQQAARFATAAPPRRADLASYGAGFAEHLRAVLPPDLAYVAEVARFDWALAAAVAGAPGSRRFDIEPAIALELPGHLAVLALAAPADLIRDALEDDGALAALDITRPRWLAAWRKQDHAAVWPLPQAAAIFLAVLLDGGTAPDALAAALACDPTAPGAIRDAVFAAPFCRVILNQEISNEP